MLMEHEHSPEAIQARLATEPRHTYLRDWVYGGIDGAVTTFAIVSGVMGAELSAGIVLVLGVANLVADGFSMAASNYAGTRTERDELRYWEAVEHRHVDTVPEGEREEVRQIFRQKGLTGADLERVVAAITADRERWVRTMLAEEYGLPRQVRSPWRAALSTFSAFVLCGLAPLCPFALGLPQAFGLAIALTAGVFFTIGAVRSRWSPALWWHSGLSTLGMGMTAAGLAYGAGAWLKTLLQDAITGKNLGAMCTLRLSWSSDLQAVWIMSGMGTHPGPSMLAIVAFLLQQHMQSRVLTALAFTMEVEAVVSAARRLRGRRT